MSESYFYHFSKLGKMSIVSTVEEALEKAETEGFIWLSYTQPAKEDLTVLIEPLGLHPLSVEDCLDEYQIPKIENLPTNTFILLNAFRYIDQSLIIDEVNLFIGENFIITVNKRGPDEQKLLGGIEHHIAMNIETTRQGPAFLLHLIIDQIVDQKFIAIELLESELDRAEDEIIVNLARFNPSELQHLRRDLLSLRKSLFHEREILVKICRKDSPFIPEKAIYHFRDIYDHLAKFFELTESYRELVTSLMEMYLSLLNNKMANAANQTNFTVRRLTFITTIFMPLTLLSGIGGMSEWSMMTGPENWKISYSSFLLGMVVIGIANYFLLRWLDKRNMSKSTSLTDSYN